MENKNLRNNLKKITIKNVETLNKIESRFRQNFDNEILPQSIGVNFASIAENMIPDQNGEWSSPLIFIKALHNPIHGKTNLCTEAYKYLIERQKIELFDLLSISADMEGNKLALKILIRAYNGDFDFSEFFDIMGDPLVEDLTIEYQSGNLQIPDEIKNFSYTEEEEIIHDKEYAKQCEVFKQNTKNKPFLNQIDKYVPRKLPRPEDHMDFIYDLKTSDMQTDTILPYEEYIEIFKEVMIFVNGVEYYHFISVIQGEESEEEFMSFLEDYINSEYVETRRMTKEDVPKLLEKLHKALFQLYVIQDLIDDPQVTDIKITAPDSIRARIHGKAYMSNITFIDEYDYKRFVNGIAIKNGISQDVPEQTFTDTRDENYILRLSLTAQYVNSVPWPYLHVRKVDRKKPLAKELMGYGMLNEKTRDYLLDCGKNSRGVVFTGPPGSGKTVCLNWFLEEAYEQSAEILVIQENDELFAYRKGVMFQHVVLYAEDNQMPVNLEQLGQLALVAGANVFIIGEAKGAEICSAITLSNSGCRTAITIHSPSSTETINKMADLAMRGYAKDIDQAKRMLQSFQTIVYLEDFKIREISEITGYDEEKHDMTYNYIYRDEEWAKDKGRA